MTSALWVHFYASLRRKFTGEFSCSGTYLVYAKVPAEINNKQPEQMWLRTNLNHMQQ